MGGREGTAMLGTKMETAALLLTPPTTRGQEGRGPPSLRPKPKPKNLKAFEVVQGRRKRSFERIILRETYSAVNPQRRRCRSTPATRCALAILFLGFRFHFWGFGFALFSLHTPAAANRKYQPSLRLQLQPNTPKPKRI